MSNSANETATSCTCTYLSSPVKLIKHTMKLNKAHLATSVVEWQRFKLTCLEMVPGSKTKISFTDESVTCLHLSLRAERLENLLAYLAWNTNQQHAICLFFTFD